MAKQIIDGFVYRDSAFNIAPGASFFATKTTVKPEDLAEPEAKPDEAAEPLEPAADSETPAAAEPSEPAATEDEIPEMNSSSEDETLAPDKNLSPVKRGNNSSNQKQPKSPWWKDHKLLSVGVVIVVIVIVLIGGGSIYFRDKALPGSYLMGHNVTGFSRQKLADLISSSEQSFALTITNQKQKLTPSRDDIGLSFDAVTTTDQVMGVHRSGGFWQRLNMWQHQDVGLVAKLDQSKFDKYLTSHVKTAIVKPVDAKIAFDAASQNFKIQPDKPGSGILLDQAAGEILASAAKGQPVNMAISTKPTYANIRTADLSATLDQAESYLKPSVSLTVGSSQIVPSAQQRAAWLSFTANQNHSYDVSVNQKAITSYTAALAGQLHRAMQPQLTIKMQNGSAGGVIQAGQNGQDVTNQAELTAALVKAFSGRQSYRGPVVLRSTPFTTQNMTAYPKWIYVSLSQQRLTAYEYNKPVYSFLISSGVPGHDTEIGVFHVWYKVPVQTMKGGSLASGDYYDLPNVHWDTYFDGQEAIHEAYWHHNFGHPMSHGCLNATYADAKWIYDWAPLGTTVVVQN